MLDFFIISTRSVKKDLVEIYPKFIIKKSSDLMIRGGDFYAIWNEETKLWSTDEQDAVRLIDREIKKYYEENKNKFNCNVRTLYLWDADSGMIDKWHKYCQKQMRDDFHMLDEKIIFSNYETKKDDYASKKLQYPLEKCDISSYDKIMSTLYDEDERQKLEWAIGSIVSGESKHLQKFIVLYGDAGTGKSTILNIIQKLFNGYDAVFDAKALGSTNNVFALEAFKGNPLVGIQHDGDLSRIEDNTRLNSLVSHEKMTVNEKFKSTYANDFKCFLFMGTNKPVKITDAKSGLIRRLIDVAPSGNKLPSKEYKTLVKQVDFELGGIAYHCKEVFESKPNRYDDYIPRAMMGASNDFYNFVLDSYFVFKKEDSTTLTAAWSMYKEYCEDAKVPFPLSRRIFKEELKSYFKEYKDRFNLENGTRVRSYYEGFITEKFEEIIIETDNKEVSNDWIAFSQNESVFDEFCSDCPAQYASSKETPLKKWEDVTNTLNDLDTKKLHYVKVPENHIVIDFDIPDENGNKSLEKNLEAANKFPKTYAELSKSGQGIHLHYIYNGNVNELNRVYAEHIEVKIFTGKASLRRKLTKCNDISIAIINSGLPMKGEKKVINFDTVKSEMGLRALIKRNLNKEIHPGTKPSIDFIYKILTDAYEDGLKYDVTDMRNAILAFAAGSTHKAEYCIKLVNEMPFKSEEPSESVDDSDAKMVFYDVEVFPNLFLINWKMEGPDKKIVRMINPTPAEVEELMRFKLVGFNCRRYDNHILYARLMGYTNEQLYNLSQKIIKGSPNCFFGKAYNISYTDVYDFSSKKQSLKKFEIDLGIHHQELGLPWDKPVPEELWIKVAEYCDNDVLATEAVFNARKADFVARQILAKLAGGTVNDTTNSLTTKIIFGNERHPQHEFNYRDLGEVSSSDYIPDGFDDYTRFNGKKPISDDFMPYGQPVFPGYEYEAGKSTYRGIEVGEGGYAEGEPGMYGYVALLDVESMHPHSATDERLFGSYTKRFEDILNARLAIKHGDFKKARTMLNGALEEFLNGDYNPDDLAYALKIAINSVYGLTSAGFENAFRDIRNVDNIVAKRGALFMINLKFEVAKRGFIAAHIKTDSIKIPDATPEIIDFVMEYGRMYGYKFEHEATYDRMCLVNDAVYIAKYASKEFCENRYGYVPEKNQKKENEWTATGTQFAVPYVFKTLFSGEEILFEDMCETKSVTSSLYLDMNEGLPDVTEYEKVKQLRIKMPDWNSNNLEPAKKDEKLLLKYSDLSDEELETKINEGHKYKFIGRVGQFCPIKAGSGGGQLVREKNGKYYAATGTKGYRWLESEMVKELNKEDCIDRLYYDNLVTDAANTIITYGDIEWFRSDEPYVEPEFKDGRPVYTDYKIINK